MARIGNTSKKKVKRVKKTNDSFGVWQLNLIIILILLQNIFLLYKNKEKIYDFLGHNTVEAKVKKIPVKTASFDITPKVKKDDKVIVSEAVVKEKEPVAIPKRKIRVSVMNGCRVRGIAGKWKKLLRKIDFDVRDTGNTPKVYSKSIVISRKKDMKPAYLLAKQVGIAKNRVIQQLNKNIVDIDAELVIGKDYSHLKKPKN